MELYKEKLTYKKIMSLTEDYDFNSLPKQIIEPAYKDGITGFAVAIAGFKTNCFKEMVNQKSYAEALEKLINGILTPGLLNIKLARTTIDYAYRLWENDSNFRHDKFCKNFDIFDYFKGLELDVKNEKFINEIEVQVNKVINIRMNPEKEDILRELVEHEEFLPDETEFIVLLAKFYTSNGEVHYKDALRDLAKFTYPYTGTSDYKNMYRRLCRNYIDKNETMRENCIKEALKLNELFYSE